MTTTIDYMFSDLSEHEIAAHIQSEQERQADEREQERKRIEKINSFRFVGGMC